MTTPKYAHDFEVEDKVWVNTGYGGIPRWEVMIVNGVTPLTVSIVRENGSRYRQRFDPALLRRINENVGAIMLMQIDIDNCLIAIRNINKRIQELL